MGPAYFYFKKKFSPQKKTSKKKPPHKQQNPTPQNPKLFHLHLITTNKMQTERHLYIHMQVDK